MHCGKMQTRLDAYVDNRLPPSERQAVEEHFRLCPVCRESARQAVRLAGLLASVPAPEVPPDLADRIAATAYARNTVRASPRRTVTIGVWWQEASVPLRAAASLLLVLALTLGTLMSWSVTQQAPPPADGAFDYGLNSLAGAPDGSLEQVYLTLLGSPTDGRQ